MSKSRETINHPMTGTKVGTHALGDISKGLIVPMIPTCSVWFNKVSMFRGMSEYGLWAISGYPPSGYSSCLHPPCLLEILLAALHGYNNVELLLEFSCMFMYLRKAGGLGI